MNELPDNALETARESLKRIPFVQSLGIEIVEISHGEAKIRLQIEEKHHRDGGFMHGGVTASMIDTVTAFAVGTIVETFLIDAVTVNLTVNYLRPIFKGEVIATAKVIRAGKRLLTVSADVFDENGAHAATALT
ncbi:MAG: PaaI family thioesterase, partial [Pyrinomonadaceae bacterium]|nr:PaaI family thioesterase [Pyrinomonadaceae bacterium]